MKKKLSCWKLSRQLLQLMMAGVLVLGLAACGGSGGDVVGDNSQAEQQSKLLVSLTDTEGDFLTYQVDVTNIDMTRANGAVVNLLPQTTTIDFAQYVEVTELLTIFDAPVGRYNSASLTLDFSNALITVQDAEGNPITAQVVDENGNPLSETTVDIRFNDRDGFTLAPGIPAHVTLDFDLDASNDVVIEGETATVTVNPILIADTILEEPKTFRVRGLLAGVSVEEEAFDLELRPFRVRLGRFGDAEVLVTADTTYEIDGVTVASEEGLQVLAEKQPLTAVVTEGYWDRESREFIAATVYAGSSVPWDQEDILRGTVVGREGNSLSVRGAIIQLESGAFIFNDTFTVEVSELTSVTRPGDQAVTLDQISVGSAIYATGDVSDDTTLDATEGRVRIHYSSVAGLVVSASPLTVDISLLNGRRSLIYDFGGTGTSAATDADPVSYEVFTSTLDLSGMDIDDPVRIRGFVTDFGSAPEDFSASTLINAADVRGHMVVNYGLDGSELAVTSVDENGLQLDVTDALNRHHIVRAGIPLNLKDLDNTPLVVPGGDRGVYGIRVNGRVEIYTFYSGFIDALTDDLSNGSVVRRFDAHGFFDSEMNTFASKRMLISLN